MQVEALLQKHWFQIQIILKLEELFNMLLTNRVLGSCCVINPYPGLHVGFCMLPQHFKTNFMQLCLETKWFLETNLLTRNVFTNLFLKCR